MYVKAKKSLNTELKYFLRSKEHKDVNEVEFCDLSGQFVRGIIEARQDGFIVFLTDEHVFFLEHDQECCESVYIEDIIGDLSELVGQKIVSAEDVYSDGTTENVECSTWSFYKIQGEKDSVTIRFFGESNGCYSETAGLYRVDKECWDIILSKIS